MGKVQDAEKRKEVDPNSISFWKALARREPHSAGLLLGARCSPIGTIQEVTLGTEERSLRERPMPLRTPKPTRREADLAATDSELHCPSRSAWIINSGNCTLPESCRTRNHTARM